MSLRFTMHLVVSALLTFIAAFGCAMRQHAESPRETLSDYASALRENRLEDAYALLSDEAKKSIPFATFNTMVRENPEEVRDFALALVRPAGPPRVTATVTAPQGETLTLVYEDGAWKIDAAAIDLYNQDTPETALGAFVRAYENRRYDVLMRFVPDSKREGLDAATLKKAFEGEQKNEIETLTQALKAALPTAKIERIGDRATMSYGAGGTVELVREHGAWKIEKF